MTLPNVAQAATDANGHFTAPWRNWLAALERANNGADTTGLQTQIAAIATALGSPDGTVAGIPAQGAPAFAITSGDGLIGVAGSPASGSVQLSLHAGASDIAYDHTASGLSATDMQAAIDEVMSTATERAQDATAALIAAGTHSGIAFSYNDAGNALSATVTAGTGTVDIRDVWLLG